MDLRVTLSLAVEYAGVDIPNGNFGKSAACPRDFHSIDV